MKPQIETAVSTTKAYAVKVWSVVKVTFIVLVILTSAVGAYVMLTAPVRNYTVDYLQNQHVVQAASPKE